MIPSVGRIVFFRFNDERPPAAAIIVKVERSPSRAEGAPDEDAYSVWITVFPPPPTVEEMAVAGPFSAVVGIADPILFGTEVGQWSWPPRVG